MNKKSINIVFFVGALHGGGGKRVMLNLVKQLDVPCINKKFLSISYDGPLKNEIPSDIPHYSLLYTEDEGRKANLVLKVKVVFRVCKLLKKLNPDIILSDGPRPLIMMFLFRMMRRKKQYWISRKGPNILSKKSDFFSKIKKNILKILYSKVDRIVVPTLYTKNNLQKTLNYRKKIEIIPNPVDIVQLKKLSEQLNTVYNIANKNIQYIVVVNRLVKLKRTELVIEAFKKVNKVHSDLYLVIIGDGPEKTELIKKARGYEDKVIFLGQIDNPLPIIRDAEALVLASENEGFGYVLIEAMVCGCVPIAFDLSHGPSEIIKNDINGVLLPGEMPINEIEEAVTKIIENVEYKINLETEGLKSVEQYSSEVVSKKYAELFFKVYNQV